MDPQAAKALVALLAISNPIGNSALYVTMTEGASPAQRSRVALICALAVLVTLAIAAAAGDDLLRLFGINVDDLRVAGGLVVLLIGLSMLRAQSSGMHHGADETREGQAKESPAVVPLAIPIVAGPGTMATTIVYADRLDTTDQWLIFAATLLLVVISVYACFRSAVVLKRAFGASGMNILVRVMGLVLAAIAIDMMAVGLRGIFPALAGGPS
jgi:multiple antibiotic resistance protein